MQVTVASLRQRFAAGGLPSSEAGWVAPAGLVPAAVLIAVVMRDSGLTVILTQRTAHLRDHAGQVSFPGGRCEVHDASPVATALREAEEEIGLDPRQVEPLGCLAEYCTGTGFAVLPVVALVTPPLNLKLDDFEVEAAFEPPLEFLLDADNFQRQQLAAGGQLREYWTVPWQQYFIWGATAAMLVELRNFLLGSV